MYVYVSEADPLFGGIVSVQVVVDDWETDLPPVTDGVVQPLAEMVNVPPDAGRDVGLTLIVQALPPPGMNCVQLTVTLPEVSDEVENVPLVQVSVAACACIGTTRNPLEATAAASARLMLR